MDTNQSNHSPGTSVPRTLILRLVVNELREELTRLSEVVADQKIRIDCLNKELAHIQYIPGVVGVLCVISTVVSVISLLI